MNSKSLFKSFAVGLAGLTLASLLYAMTNNWDNRKNLLKRRYQYLHATGYPFKRGTNWVVIEFYNPTCPVCNAFKNKGIYRQTAAALPHIKFGMTSSDQGAKLHREFKIEAFPTFVWFRDGKEVGRYKGYVENPMFTRKVSGIFSAAELNATQENQ